MYNSPLHLLKSCSTKIIKEQNLYRILLVISIFFTPICFLFFMQRAFFNDMPSIDAFIYVGYGHNYLDHTFLNDYYKISRLPWVLVEFLFRNIFSPDLAYYVLHFSLYAISSYLIFKITQKISGNLVAYIAAIVMPIFLFLYCGEADYNNNFSATLFLGLILHIINGTNDSKDNSRNFFLITGAIYALIIHTNILLSIEALVYGTAFYAAIKLNRNEKVFESFNKKIIFTLIGFLLCTLILCLINYSVGRDFFFMKVLLAFMFKSNPGNNTEYWQPLNNFIWNSKFLAPFLALFCYSTFLTVYLFFKKLPKEKTTILLLNSAFIFIFCKAFLMQILGINNLQMSYFAFIILLPFLLTLSANFGFIFDNQKLNLTIKRTLCIAIIGAAFLTITFLKIDTIYKHDFFFINRPFCDILLIWMLFFAVCFLLREKLNYFLSSTLVLIYFLIITFTSSGYPNYGYFINYKKNDYLCNRAHSISTAYIEFNNHVKKYKLNPNAEGNLFAWWNKEQHLYYNDCTIKNITQNKVNRIYDTISITQPSRSLIAASSGFVIPLDNPWRDDGINKIDDLWKTTDSQEIWNKTRFLQQSKDPRILVLISYDDHDVEKMIAKMKHYKINFSLVEKRLILTNAFTLQYYILKEEIGK